MHRLLLLVLVLVSVPAVSGACSRPGPIRNPSLPSHIQFDRPLIFVATVTNVRGGIKHPLYPEGLLTEYELTVERYLRGDGPRIFVFFWVLENTGAIDCGLPRHNVDMTQGVRLLVFEEPATDNRRHMGSPFMKLLQDSGQPAILPVKDRFANFSGMVQALEAGWSPDVEYDEFVRTKR